MSTITQTIPSYTAGISEQPDHLKFPGQLVDIVNGIPDLTKGLYKRPGSKRVGNAPLTNVQSGGSWFHYYRDEAEGAYIGQVDANGNVRVWKASGDNAGAVEQQLIKLILLRVIQKTYNFLQLMIQHSLVIEIQLMLIL